MFQYSQLSRVVWKPRILRARAIPERVSVLSVESSGLEAWWRDIYVPYFNVSVLSVESSGLEVRTANHRYLLPSVSVLSVESSGLEVCEQFDNIWIEWTFQYSQLSRVVWKPSPT